MKTIFWDISTQQRYKARIPLPEMPQIPREAVLVIGGDAPVWRYCQALNQASGTLHGLGAAALAVFDPKLGAVIIDSHSPRYRAGDTITLQWPHTQTVKKKDARKNNLAVKAIEESSAQPPEKTSLRSFRTKLRSIKGKYLYGNIKEPQKIRTWMDKTGFFRIPDKDQE